MAKMTKNEEQRIKELLSSLVALSMSMKIKVTDVSFDDALSELKSRLTMMIDVIDKERQ